jgi:gluconolactonase
MNPSLTIYKEELNTFIHTDFTIKTLDDSCLFSEGPVWNKAGFYLFSDIPANVIYKLEEGKPKEVYLANSGMDEPQHAEHEQMGSNGLAYDQHGILYICQHGNGAVALYDGGNIKPLVSAFNGKRLNSPNDIIVHKDGTIFFSDPPYGLKDQKLNSEKYQSAAGLYVYRNGELNLFCNAYQYPNGVCLSPDQQSIYTCSNKPFEAKVLEFDATTLSLTRTVCNETSDGIKCDAHGNFYLCNKEGILIINNRGERIGLIQLPTVPANCCWGGAQGKDLLVCARQNIFLIEGLQQ